MECVFGREGVRLSVMDSWVVEQEAYAVGACISMQAAGRNDSVVAKDSVKRSAMAVTGHP